MGILARKMWRTIWKSKAQYFAITVLILLGTATYVSMSTTYSNLEQARDLFYRAADFADYYFEVVGAPEEIIAQIDKVSGVMDAAGRVEMNVPVIEANKKRSTLHIISCSPSPDIGLNRFQLRSGRAFMPGSPNIEVLLDPQYAQANNLSAYDSLEVVVANQTKTLSVIGTAISPEFIYALQDASSLAPDHEVFGIGLVPLDQAQQILNFEGQINQVLIKLQPDADQTEVASQVETILEPYGNLTSYSKANQLSNYILNGELSVLKLMAHSLPLIFFMIAMVIQYILLNRVIKNQYLQIGVMKAMGYSNYQIMWHYTGYALVVSLSGGIMGSLLGIFLASLMSQMYGQFFNLPSIIGSLNLETLTVGILLSAAAGLLAGITATRGVAIITPTEAMGARTLSGGDHMPLARFDGRWSRLSLAWRMTLRTTGRNKIRYLAAVFGVAAAVGLVVMSLAGNDTMNRFLHSYYTNEQRYEYLVNLTRPVREGELMNISRLDGVVQSEPILQIPVKITYRGQTQNKILVGINPAGTMKQPVDKTGQPLPLPDNGLLIDNITARKLGVKGGEQLNLRTILPIGPSHQMDIEVVGIAEESMGGEEYTSLSQANRILGESDVVTGIMLKADPGHKESIEEFLNSMTNVASISDKQVEYSNLRNMLDYYDFFDYIMAIFALILGFLVVFNGFLMVFAERSRELALLWVIGFSNSEIGQIIGMENILSTFPGILSGIGLGYLLSMAYIASLNNDLYTMSLVISPWTYVQAVMGGLIFAAAAYWFTLRKLAQLTPVETLKNRD